MPRKAAEAAATTKPAVKKAPTTRRTTKKATEPTCTTVTDGVEYHCVLAKAPAPEVSDWKGTVEPTVDATKHVNGGCRSLSSAGTSWQCYIGRAAVDQKIIGAGFLGEFAPSPGQG